VAVIREKLDMSNNEIAPLESGEEKAKFIPSEADPRFAFR
jgi:hypothetical protein